MKKIVLSFLVALMATMTWGQYTPTSNGTTFDYVNYNANAFTVCPMGLNTDQQALLTLMELSNHAAKAATELDVMPLSTAAGVDYISTSLANKYRIIKTNYSPVAKTSVAGSLKKMRMVIVRPNDATPRPCIMFTHGKGQSMADAEIYLNAVDFAMRGYVVAFYENSQSITFDNSSPIDCKNPLVSNADTLQKAVYEGFQYAVAATQWVMGSAATYCINTDKMMAMGVSFGGVTSLNLAYADPGNSGNFNNGLFSPFGVFTAKSYSQFQTQPYNGKIKAVCSIVGAALPATAKIGELFDASDTGVNCIFMASNTDPIVPIYSGQLSGCSVTVDGTFKLRERMNSKNITNRVVVNCNGLPHSPYVKPFNLSPLPANFNFDACPGNSSFNANFCNLMNTAYYLLQIVQFNHIVVQEFKKVQLGQLATAPSYTAAVTYPASRILSVHPYDVNILPLCGANATLVAMACGTATPTAPGVPAVNYREANTETTTSLTIYPNPTSNTITIQHPIEVTQLEVYDLTGKKVGGESTNGATQTDIDLHRLPAGMYFVKADNGMIQKVVKQ